MCVCIGIEIENGLSVRDNRMLEVLWYSIDFALDFS